MLSQKQSDFLVGFLIGLVAANLVVFQFLSRMAL